MADIWIRQEKQAGRITLQRPDAMNALTHEMCLAIEAALDGWRHDDSVMGVIIDGEGDHFCAGGDIVQMYRTAMAGDFDYGRRFWRDEYRLNRKIFEYPKPYVALMQGYIMGGGVGVSCHGTHRIVGGSSRIAMPECGIGLVPDVGGTLLLALAPGRCGEYLGTTGTRMDAADAIWAGFADHFIPEDFWPQLINDIASGVPIDAAIDSFSQPAEPSQLSQLQSEIDYHFAGEALGDILRSLNSDDTEFVRSALKALSRASPLSAAATIELVHRARSADAIARVLEQEYRFTFRAAEKGDFVEGIRAMVIDKDRAPNWQHPTLDDVGHLDVVQMLLPLGDDALNLEDQP